MTKKRAIEIITNEPSKRRAVLAILKNFEGESFTDAAEILDCAKYYLTSNVYFDFNLASDIIAADAVIGDSDDLQD